jgi:hypothetical protein
LKNATEFVKKFKTFRKKLPKEEVIYSNHGPIGELIYSHLLWNATAKQADAAYKKLIDAVVDMNDLRMNHVFEMIEIIGVAYPQAEERAKRLKSVLNAIYKREHNVTLDSLEGVGKRDVREYFETLNGITLFACNRVISMSFEVAAVPVDDRTLDALISNKIVHEEVSLVETSAWLGRQVKATEVLEIHACLQAWVELQPVRKQAKKKVVKKAPLKKAVVKKSPKQKAKKETTKKKVTKKVTKKKVTKKSATKKTVNKKEAKKPTTKKIVKKKVTKKSATKKIVKKKVAKKKTPKKTVRKKTKK